MDENVLGAFPAGEESEASRPIEPFDDDDLERADRACVRPGARRRGLGGEGRVGLGDRNHPEHLKAALTPLRLGDDARALANGRESVAPQNGHVDENVSLAAIGHNEPVALDDVEPFDAPSDFHQPYGAFVGLRGARHRLRRLDKFLAHFGPHSTRRLTHPRRL